MKLYAWAGRTLAALVDLHERPLPDAQEALAQLAPFVKLYGAAEASTALMRLISSLPEDTEDERMYRAWISWHAGAFMGNLFQGRNIKVIDSTSR